MAFTANEIFNLTHTVYAMHRIDLATKKLSHIGLELDGCTSETSIGHDFFKALDDLSDIFLTICRIYPTAANIHGVDGKLLESETAETALQELMSFIETDNADCATDIIEFAADLSERYRKQKGE